MDQNSESKEIEVAILRYKQSDRFQRYYKLECPDCIFFDKETRYCHVKSKPVCNRSYCSWMMWNQLCDKCNLQDMKRSAESIAEVKPNLP